MRISPGLVTVICLIFGRACGESVIQKQGHVTVTEGASISINCTYTATGYPALFWYVQYPGEGLQLLINVYKANERGSHKGFEAIYDKEATSFHLEKAEVLVSDSAMYFCALNDQGGSEKLIFGKGTKLTVNPYISNPEPSVYQLKDPKFRNTSICLFTDFDSQIDVAQGSKDMESEVFYSGKTVLDMRSIDFKSNGAVAWSKKTGFECTGIFPEKVSLPSPDHSCDAKLVEKSFETDMNLNFQNLSVIGFRILLLKVTGFNVLMTLRLWSH